MAKTQWLQCTIPMENWTKLNERRLKLGITWAAILEPAASEYLDKLEAAKAPATKATPTAKKGTSKRANNGKGKSSKAPTTKAPETTDSKKAKAQSGEAPADADLKELAGLREAK